MSGRLAVLVGMVVVSSFGALNARAEGASCPVDHTPLPALNFLVGEQTGLRLDLRPIGDGGVLEPLTRCPTCGLVLEGIPHEVDGLPKLRIALEAPAVRAARTQRSNRFLKAMTLQTLQASAEVRARAWLEAAWELEGVDDQRRRASLERALATYAEVEAANTLDSSFRHTINELTRTAALLQVELLRQLGRFDAAQTKLESLIARPEFNRGLYRFLVPQEAALVAAHDSRPQAIARVSPLDPRDDDPEYLYAQTMPGWQQFANTFDLVRVFRGHINSEVPSQYSSIRSSAPRLVDAIRWWNPLTDQNAPDLTWHDLLAAHERAERAAAKYPWLARWKAANPLHSLELQLVGTRTWTTHADERVAPLWRDSGLMGTPSIEFQLRSADASWAELFVDEQGKGSVIVYTQGPRSGTDWLDSLYIEYGSQYGVVSPEGDVQVRPLPQEKVAP